MKYFGVLLLLIICNAANAGRLNLVAFIAAPARTVADTDSVLKERSISVGASYGSDILFFGRFLVSSKGSSFSGLGWRLAFATSLILFFSSCSCFLLFFGGIRQRAIIKQS